MSPLVMSIFGGILIAYGLFRIYRGVRQLTTDKRTTED
jgi:hypothetical protein